jgi:enamine deaminase RidA (YjgF/YER057c/UK114 family)
MDFYENIKKHNYSIPEGLAPAGLYLPVNQVGNLLFVSGQGSNDNGKNLVGRAGIDVTLEEAQYAAKVCMLNTLGALQAYLGDLNRIKKVVKILGFVACADDFTKQALVMNGASEVLINVFGEAGKHARSAIGTNSLPLGLTVEVESIFEIE